MIDTTSSLNIKPFTLSVPVERNPLLAKVLKNINENVQIQTLWHMLNINAMKRLGMTDHGPVHFQLVANIALKMMRLLKKKDASFGIVEDYGLSYEHAEVVVFLASVMHDLGMSVNRKGHEEFSLVVSLPILQEVLSFLPLELRTLMIAETQHAIISHRKDGQPLTTEAGIVRVADALDMTKGRSRIPYESGKVDIHSVSAQAIDTIAISAGTITPIHVDIIMNHTAGIFQVDDLLHKKVTGSGIEKYLEIEIYIDQGHGKKLLKDAMKVSQPRNTGPKIE